MVTFSQGSTIRKTAVAMDAIVLGDVSWGGGEMGVGQKPNGSPG